MKICLIAQLNSAHTVRWANAIAAKGIEVVILSPSTLPLGGRLTNDISVCSLNIPENHFYYRPPVGKVFCYWRRLRSYLRELSPDIIHMHYIPSAFTNIFFWNRLPNLVISVYGSDIIVVTDDIGTRKGFYKKRILRKSKVVTATTKYLADQTARYLSPTWPMEIIPFGIDLKMFYPVHSLREKKDILRIGFCKHLSWKYAPLTLIKAFAKIVKFYPQLELVLCGEGNLEEEAKMLTQDLAISEKVRFMGRIPYDEVPAMINTFDISVTPSVSETFGVAAVEAQACGVPVIVSDLPGFREAVDPGKTALLFPSEDEQSLSQVIIRLIQDRKKRKAMGDAGVEYVRKHFNIQNSVNKYIEIYERVIASLKV